VDINGKCSAPVPVLSSVIQGSAIGPLCFLLYSSSLLTLINENCSGYAFADDCKFWSSDPNSLQETLHKVHSWCDSWQLSLSAPKCCVLALGQSPPVTLSLQGHTLPVVSTVRDLGVIMDSSLSFTPHVEAICKKARRACYAVSRCFLINNRKRLVHAYKTFIRPILESSSPVWNSVSKADEKAIESVQRYWTREIFRKCHLSMKPYEDRLRILKLDSLERRRLVTDLRLAHKIYHDLTHGPNLLTHKVLPRTLQHNYRLSSEITVRKQRRLHFTNRVVSSWNTLPDHVISSSPAAFKSAVHKLFIQNGSEL
jgi:hypothetical protein